MLVSVGSTTNKTHTFKRAQDAKVDEKFEFPLPSDHHLRGWELWIRVIDSQTSSPLGQISLDLNDVFSEDEGKSKREPLKLEYTSIALALEPCRFGEEVSGTVTISLSCTTALPKAVLVQESRAGVIDTNVPEELFKRITTEPQRNYMKRVASLVTDFNTALPELVSSIGGIMVWQSVLGDFSNSAATACSAGFVYSPNVVGSPSSSSSGVPKVKSFLKSLGQGGSGTGSGLLAGIGKRTAVSQDGVTTANDLPPEILSRIFTYLPPWSSLRIRRVCRLWDASAEPRLPELFALLNAFQKKRAADKDQAVAKAAVFEALPFIRMFIRYNAFQTTAQFISTPSFPSFSASSVASAALSSATVSAATDGSSSSVPAAGSSIGLSSAPSDAIFNDPKLRTNPPVSFESVADLMSALLMLESWRRTVVDVLGNARNREIWNAAIGYIESNWAKHIDVDTHDPVDLASFSDTHFWTSLKESFTAGTVNPLPKYLSRLLNNVEQYEVQSFTTRLREQIEKKVCASPDQFPRLIEMYILLSIFIKFTLDEPKSGKANKRFAFLKDFEAIIPADCTRYLITYELMKDKTYTKFL